MPRLLLLDDSRFSCNWIKAMIQGVAPELIIDTLNSSVEALKTICENPTLYDAIFLDYNMPVMDGLELAEKLHEKFPNIKIALLTASSAFTTGAKKVPVDIKFILKPPSNEDFQEVLTSLGLLVKQVG